MENKKLGLWATTKVQSRKKGWNLQSARNQIKNLPDLELRNLTEIRNLGSFFLFQIADLRIFVW